MPAIVCCCAPAASGNWPYRAYQVSASLCILDKMDSSTGSASAASLSDPPVPPVLCVDLDGTLVLGDTLHESLLSVARSRPWRLLRILLTAFKGKAHFKAEVARHASLSAATLPYNQPLLDYLRAQKSAGRRIVLATAADSSIATAVASHFGSLFDQVLSTQNGRNLRGEEKGRVLAEAFGTKGFSYAGNDTTDLEVWNYAGYAVAVNLDRSVEARIQPPVEAAFPRSRTGWRVLTSALRVHHWVKNLLVFLPLITSHDLANGGAVIKLSLVALALSLVASAQYLLNDLLDLDADRQHPSKKSRPFASGALPIPLGLALVAGLGTTGMIMGYLLGSWWPLVGLGAYFTLSVTYSATFKTMPLVDVFALTGLYVLRIVLGGIVSGHTVTAWLLSFSFLLFLSLALLKRYAEITAVGDAARHSTGRRPYFASDALLLAAMGLGSSFASIVVLALYLYSEAAEQVYSHPMALWGVVPACLFAQCWLWLSASRGRIDADPVGFALTDRYVWASAAIGAAAYLGASW